MTYQELKTHFVELLHSLHYNVDDTGTYRDGYPWIKISISSIFNATTRYVHQRKVVIKLDIFSAYNGEKEILDILENIENAAQNDWFESPNIETWQFDRCQIIDDQETGPCRKHGIAFYTFTFTEGSSN